MKTLKIWRVTAGEKIKTALLRINCLFAFTRADRRALRTLLGIFFCAILLRAWAGIKPAKEYIPQADETALAKTLLKKGNFRPEGNATGNRADSAARPRYTPPAYMQKRKFSVDLNRADTFDLQEIRGIGSGFARRIVQHREKLGGFTHTRQLREVWGIDEELYQKILPYVYVKEPVFRKIDLNSADIKTLRNHPYLDYYQAKEIYLYRTERNGFKSIEELKTVSLIDEDTYQRLKPYLYVGKPEEPAATP